MAKASIWDCNIFAQPTSPQPRSVSVAPTVSRSRAIKRNPRCSANELHLIQEIRDFEHEYIEEFPCQRMSTDIIYSSILSSTVQWLNHRNALCRRSYPNANHFDGKSIDEPIKWPTINKHGFIWIGDYCDKIVKWLTTANEEVSNAFNGYDVRAIDTHPSMARIIVFARIWQKSPHWIASWMDRLANHRLPSIEPSPATSSNAPNHKQA